MPYPKKLLNDYETVAVDLHPHWWFFAGPVSAMVGSILLGFGTLIWTAGGSGQRWTLGWLSIGLIVFSGGWLVSRYGRWATTNFVITSDRLIFRAGIIGKRGVEIPLERVNNVLFTQGIFERLVGAGDLVIESGEGQQKFDDIKNPERVQNQIHAQMEENENRRFTRGQPVAAPLDVATQLEKLEGLLERGTLSPEEFDGQKRRLLGG
jgi:uncharacterized membrane protein YdbT with pleckstrin-like domain